MRFAERSIQALNWTFGIEILIVVDALLVAPASELDLWN